MPTVVTMRRDSWWPSVCRRTPLDGVTIVPTSGEGTALLALWQDTDAVVLVDAVCAGARPGILHRFAVGTQPLPALFLRVSTHAFGVAEAIELARALRQLPPALVGYGVEGATFETDAGPLGGGCGGGAAGRRTGTTGFAGADR